MTLASNYKQVAGSLTTAVILLDASLRMILMNTASKTLIRKELKQVCGFTILLLPSVPMHYKNTTG